MPRQKAGASSVFPSCTIEINGRCRFQFYAELCKVLRRDLDRNCNSTYFFCRQNQLHLRSKSNTPLYINHARIKHNLTFEGLHIHKRRHGNGTARARQHIPSGSAAAAARQCPPPPPRRILGSLGTALGAAAVALPTNLIFSLRLRRRRRRRIDRSNFWPRALEATDRDRPPRPTAAPVH